MPKIAVDTGEVYDAHEAAKLIGIGYATVYRWLKSGKLIAIKLAGRTLIPKSEVDRLTNNANDKSKESIKP
jgi:excisionase family DNA binding protein